MVVCSAATASSTSHFRTPLIAASVPINAHRPAHSISFPSSSSSSSAITTGLPISASSNRRCRLGFGRLTRAAALSREIQGEHDPELRIVLELATDAELYELERILFGPSRVDSEYVAIGEDLEERESLISLLESRFLFLAADARATLRGWRPSYRAALLAVRKKLKIHCSSKLATEDLEIEIFLHLLRDYSSEESENFLSSNENMKSSSADGGLELGLSQWKVLISAAFKGGGAEIKSMFFKGGTMFTLGKIYQLGGQFAAISLESRAALLAAKQGFTGAATSYMGLRTMMYFLGPVMWGTLLADVVIQMLGTDYARILRAIYAFAQDLVCSDLHGMVTSVGRIMYMLAVAQLLPLPSAPNHPWELAYFELKSQYELSENED
ncbi:unnamed protein product [Rhodiola kirilowii]